MKKLLLVTFLFSFQFFMAQVGINTTSPNAQLDIQSTNQAAPSNTDGILIPKIDVFPASNPTAAQQGMLVYLTTATTFSGNPKPIGFYYWNNTPADWIAVKGADGGTLDQAYDFGGAGNGKTITADAGAVNISGTDGLVSIRTAVNGAVAPTGSGVRMVWNPRKAAFRAGQVFATEWDDINIGNGSIAFGIGTISSANQTSAFGFSTTASGNVASAFGSSTIASGSVATSFGSSTIASGSVATAFGQGNTAPSFGETVVGIGATTYTPSTNGVTQFRAANTKDRLFVIGNAIDTNNNNTVDTAERSDAMVVLKNGATGIGTSLPNGILDVNASDNGILIPRVALSSLFVQSPIVNPQVGPLPTSTLVYNNATAGVSPNNVYPGFYYWNGTRWIRFDVNGENNPIYYIAVGTSDTLALSSFRLMNEMSITFTPKDDIALVNFSAAGHRLDDFCSDIGIFFQIVLNGIPVTGWQTSSNQSVVDYGAFGFERAIETWDTNISYPITVPIGISQTIQIQWYSPACPTYNDVGSPFTAFGAVFKSYRSLTIIDPNGGGGIVGSPPVTTNLWAHNGNSGTNSLLNFVGTADAQPLVLKSNNVEGMRIATNGNVGIGSSSPQSKLHVVGNIRMVDGNQAAGKVLTSDVNGTATWQNLSDNAWGLLGNTGTNAATNFIGTTDNNDLVFKRFNTRAGIIGTTNTSFGLSALSPISTGANNTAIGSGSLNVNTTGGDNMAAGFNTLTSNTTGSHNTTVGVAAMVSNLTGNFNTAIGRSALFDNTSGINNTGVGYNALGNITIGTNNTAIGYNSFPSIIQGNNNTALGAETNASSTIFENATAIGYKAMVGNSNVMVLGSINGVNGATSSVNVGIGTSSPQTALEVVDANVVTSGSVEGNLNVMTNGAQAIDRGGSITLGGTINDAGTTFRTFGSIEGRKTNATASSSSGYLLFKTNNAGTLSERMRITNAGDVGIGIAAPGGQFELSLNEGRKPTSNTWTIPSDARLKNVNGIYEKGLAEILQLKPIRYHYKNTDKRTFDPRVLDKEAYGFLAQEVQTIFPEAVGTDHDGYLNFDLHPILIASVNALKELNAQNTQLKNENETLRTAIQQMEQKVAVILSEIENLKK